MSFIKKKNDEEMDFEKEEHINCCIFKDSGNVKVSLVVYPKKGIRVIKKEIFYPTNNQINSESLLSNLKHKNLVECYKIIINKDKTKMTIYMEYLKKGTLSNIIDQIHLNNNRRLVERKDLILFSGVLANEILQGLQYLHKNKITHRDIKPSNVCLSNSSEIKITDMGISIRTETTNETLYTFTGTELYIAPEMLLDEKYKGDKIDVWALGILLYIFVYGHHPFFGSVQNFNNNIQTDEYFKLKKENYKLDLKGGFNDFNTFLQNMLEFDYSKRKSIDELLNDPFIHRIKNKQTEIYNEFSKFLKYFKDEKSKY